MPYDTRLEFKLEKHMQGGFAEMVHPWIFVEIKAGESYATLDTSCVLPDYVDCGEYTDVYSSTFRLTLVSGAFFMSDTDEEFDYSPEFNDYYDTTAYRYCLGGGWTPGGGGSVGG